MPAINRLLIQKDLRALRSVLWLPGVAWLAFLLFPTTVSSNVDATLFWYRLLQFPGMVLLLFVVHRLVQLDPPTGSEAFLGTRPVTRLQILGAKAKVAALFLVLPVVAVRLAALLLLSHGLGFGGMLGVLVDQIILVGALVGALFLAASWTPTLPGYLGVLLGGGVAFGLAEHAWWRLAAWIESPRRVDDGVLLPDLAWWRLLWRLVPSHSQRLDGVALAVFLAGVTVCALLQARYRRLWPVAVALAATAALAGWFASPVAPTKTTVEDGFLFDLVKRGDPNQNSWTEDPLSWHTIPPATGVSLALNHRQAITATYSYDNDIRRRVNPSGIYGEIQLAWDLALPADEYLSPVSVTTAVQTRNGRRLTQVAREDDEEDTSATRLAGAFRQIVLPGSPATTRLVSVFTAPAADSEFHDDPLVRLKGSIIWAKWRYRIVARLPLQPGATTIVGTHRMRLDRVTSKREDQEVELGVEWWSEEVAPGLLGGGADLDSNRIRFVIVQDDRQIKEGLDKRTSIQLGDYNASAANLDYGPDWVYGGGSTMINEDGTSPSAEELNESVDYHNPEPTDQSLPGFEPGLYVLYADKVGLFKQPFSVDVPPGTPVLTADPLMDMGTTIPEWIRLLTNRDYAKLLELTLPPGIELSPAEKARQVQQMAQDPQVQDRISGLLMALQSAQGMTPIYDTTGQQATFPSVASPTNKPNTPPGPLTFKKIKGRWIPQ